MSDDAALLPDVPDMAAYRKVYKYPDTWLPAMRAICRRHGLDPDALYGEPTGTNAVFRVGDGPWIKLFPPLWPEDVVRERVGLHAIEGLEGVEAPAILADETLGDWRYLLLSHVEGQAIGSVWLDLTPDEQISLGEQMGALMKRLHAADRSRCGDITEDWSEFLDLRRIGTAKRNQERGLRDGWYEPLKAFVPEAIAIVDRPFEPVFLHADLTDDHWFVRRIDGAWHVTGLIDFGDAMVGDPLYEFAAPAMFLSQRRPAVQRAMLRGYGLADTKEVRNVIRAWTIVHRFSLVENAIRVCPEPSPETLQALLDALWAEPSANRPEGTPTSP